MTDPKFLKFSVACHHRGPLTTSWQCLGSIILVIAARKFALVSKNLLHVTQVAIG